MLWDQLVKTFLLQEVSTTQVVVADSVTSLAVLNFSVEEKAILNKALAEKKGLKLIKPTLSATSPIIVLESNPKFKIQFAKSLVNVEDISKPLVDNIIANAPKVEVTAGGGLTFEDVDNKGSGANVSEMMSEQVISSGGSLPQFAHLKHYSKSFIPVSLQDGNNGDIGQQPMTTEEMMKYLPDCKQQ